MPPFVYTGGNIDARISPLRIKSVGGGGAASFFTLPVRVVDQENHVTGVFPGDTNFRFEDSPTFAPDANRLIALDILAVYNLVPDQDQWKTDRSLATAYSIRYISLEGDGVPFVPGSTINVWRGIASAIYGVQRPPASSERFLIYRIQIAETADLTDIKASALLTVRYTRP